MGATNIILGLAVLAVFSSVSETLPTCPDGWTEWRGSCYIYKWDISSKIHNKFNTGVRYDRALGVCNEIGGHVLELDSETEAKFVVNVILRDATANAYVWCKMRNGEATCGGDHGNYYNSDGSRGFWDWDTPSYYWPRDVDEEECIILRKSNPPKIRSQSCSISYTYACERGTGYTCPEGWIQFQGSCYIHVNDIDYKYRAGVSYDRAGAEKVCAALDSRILDVDSKEEAEFVVSTVIADATASAHLDCKTTANSDRAECNSGNFYKDATNQQGFWDWDTPYWPRTFTEPQCVILRRMLPPVIRAVSCGISFTYACEKAATKV